MRAPVVKAEPGPEVADLDAALDARRRDLEARAREDRVQGLEAKLKQVRSVDTVAVLKAAADRAGELARLLEGTAVKLDPDETKVRL